MKECWENFSFDWVWSLQGLGLCLLVLLSFFPAAFHVQEIIFVSLGILALIAIWFEGKVQTFQTSIDFPLGVLIGWILLTIPFSLDPTYSFGEWRKLVTQCLVFYWAVIVIRRVSSGSDVNIQWLRGGNTQYLWFVDMIFFCVVVGALALTIMAVGDFWARGGGWQDREVRAVALSSDYNWLSTYLVLAIPVIVYCCMMFRVHWKKWISVVSVGCAGVAHLAAYSRAGWLASIVQMLVLGVMVRHRSLIMIGIGTVLLLVGLLWVMGQMGYQANTLNAWTLETRVQVLRLGMEQMFNHPVVGIGYGKHIFQPILSNTPMGMKPMHLHNTFLMVGVGSGLPALGFFCWTWVVLVKDRFLGYWQGDWSRINMVKLCVGIVLVGFLGRNLFDYMMAGSLAYLFWILMACGEMASSENMA